MIPFRAQVKFFLDRPDRADVSLFMGVFQRWIQRRALDGLLIDVADYRHVFEGPGVILIGHEGDYAMESRDGRPGLVYTRKRQTDPDLPAQLRAALRLALAAAALLETEPAFEPRLTFRADEIEIRFADRLNLPNHRDSFALVRDDLAAALAQVYGASPVTLAPVDHDPRRLFTVRARAEGVASLAQLLGTAAAQAQG
jgi:hypothetical protein